MNIEKIKTFLGGKSVLEMYNDLIMVGCSHDKSLTIIETITDKILVRFEDLHFMDHPVNFDNKKRIQARGIINGQWYSVVGGPHLGGDGINTFEVWTEKLEDQKSGPIPYISKEEVEKIIIDLY